MPKAKYMHKVTAELTLPIDADPRCAALSLTENDHDGYGRVIGGDKGDLYFNGYWLDGEGNTLLDSPFVSGYLYEWSQDEINDLAVEILGLSFESIGIETVEHS